MVLFLYLPFLFSNLCSDLFSFSKILILTYLPFFYICPPFSSYSFLSTTILKISFSFFIFCLETIHIISTYIYFNTLSFLYLSDISLSLSFPYSLILRSTSLSLSTLLGCLVSVFSHPFLSIFSQLASSAIKTPLA